MQEALTFTLLATECRVPWHFFSSFSVIFQAIHLQYLAVQVHFISQVFIERDPPPPAPPPAPNKAFPYQPPCRLTFASRVTQFCIGGPFSMEDGGIQLYRLLNFQVQPTHRVICMCGYGHWCVMCVFFETRVDHQLMAYSLHPCLLVHQLID